MVLFIFYILIMFDGINEWLRTMGSEEMVEGNILEPTESYVERFASEVVVSHTPQGIFLLDFLYLKSSIIVDEDGRIKGYKGQLRPDVRIYLSPIICKRLLKALEDQIKKYEEKFGEIKESQEGG